MTITLYGIPNCDTVKKARDWLERHDVPYQFHDFKKAGVPADRLAHWLQAAGWDTLLNRKGTTWRKLDDDTRAAAVDAASASRLMVAQPSVIKRPVVEWADGTVTVGFDAADWAARA
ncbi:MAG: ArsC family reductase [Aquincola tertiaricarbonis]|uniref:ArsC family reductase n=1 Tax=Aquincola TaxID=391952 RepID=UPI000614F94E|nr:MULTISPECIES: ArsC family reductase [Aquincola]MCR5865337.1 ArsC family reductase [Aquincola sp. J276]